MVRPRYHRPRRLVDLEGLLARCPYRLRCSPVDPAADLWLAGPRAQLQLHRHNHLACVWAGVGWWHPHDSPDTRHPEPALYVEARWPSEMNWPRAWQRLAVIMLSCRATPAQHQPDARRLLTWAREPWELRGDFTHLLSATGARQHRALVELGERWPRDGSWPPSVEGWLGVGPQVAERYQLAVWGQVPAAGWASPILALADALGALPGVVGCRPAA